MNTSEQTIKPTPILQLVLFWLYVSLPLGWGIWSTIKKAMALFQ